MELEEAIGYTSQQISALQVRLSILITEKARRDAARLSAVEHESGGSW